MWFSSLSSAHLSTASSSRKAAFTSMSFVYLQLCCLFVNVCFLCFFHVVHFFPTNLRSWPDSCSFLLKPNTSDVKYVAFGLVKGPATRTYSMWYSRCFVKQLFFLRILRIVRSFTLRSELLFPGFWELLLGRLVASLAATDLKKFQRLTFFFKWSNEKQMIGDAEQKKHLLIVYVLALVFFTGIFTLCFTFIYVIA